MRWRAHAMPVADLREALGQKQRGRSWQQHSVFGGVGSPSVLQHGGRGQVGSGGVELGGARQRRCAVGCCQALQDRKQRRKRGSASCATSPMLSSLLSAFHTASASAADPPSPDGSRFTGVCHSQHAGVHSTCRNLFSLAHPKTGTQPWTSLGKACNYHFQDGLGSASIWGRARDGGNRVGAVNRQGQGGLHSRQLSDQGWVLQGCLDGGQDRQEAQPRDTCAHRVQKFGLEKCNLSCKFCGKLKNPSLDKTAREGHSCCKGRMA